MRMFFDAEYLGDYLQQRAGELLTSMQLGDKLAAALSRPEVDDMIVHALTDVSQRQDQGVRWAHAVAALPTHAPVPPTDALVLQRA